MVSTDYAFTLLDRRPPGMLGPVGQITDQKYPKPNIFKHILM